MNPMLIIGGLVVLALASIKAGTGIASKIRVVSTSLNIKSVTFTAIMYNLAIMVENQAPIAVNVTSFNGGVYIGNNLISTLQRNERTTLESEEITEMVLSGRINYTDLAPNLISLFQDPEFLKTISFPDNVYIRGKVIAGGVSIPIERKLTVNDFR